jgi:hypothetical protein
LMYKLNFRSEVQRRIYESIKNPKHDYHYHPGKVNPYKYWYPSKDSLK